MYRPISIDKACLRSILFTALLFVASIRTLFAQSDYYANVQHLTNADGLSHNHVIQVFEDSRGFIWTITVNGLNLYDGTQFRTILTWPIRYQYWQLKISTEDRKGHLWIRIIEPDQHIRHVLVNTFTRRARRPEEVYGQDLPPDIIDVSATFNDDLLVSDKAGGIWRYTYDRPARRFFQSKTGPVEFSAERYETNFVWLLDATLDPTQHSAVYSIDLQGKIHTKKIIYTLEYWYTMPDGSLQYIQCGELGIISPYGKSQFYPLGPLFRGSPPTLVPSNADYNPRTRQLWLMTFNGMHIVDYEAGLISKPTYIQQALRTSSCLDVFIDSRDVVWVATFNGLYRLTPTVRRFQLLNCNTPEGDDDILKNASRGMTETRDGKILLLSGDKLLQYTPTTKTLTTLADKFSYYTVLPANSASYWFGMSKLVRYDIPTNTFKRYSKGGMDYLEGITWSLYQQGSRLWIGNESGLMYLDEHDNSIQDFQHYNAFGALRGADIYQIIPADTSGLLWLVSSRGLFQLHPTQGIIARYWQGGKGAYHLPADNIRHMIQTQDGIYWLATTEGLVRWDRQRATHRVYGKNTGLHNANLYAVYADKYGFLWISSDLGIIQFQLASGRYRVFLESEGISHNEFNRISHLQTQDGRIYFGSLNGVTTFHPADFARDFDDENRFVVHLVGAKSFNVGADGKEPQDLLKNFSIHQQIQLEDATQDLELQFAIPHTTTTTPILYHYQIKDAGQKTAKEWITTTSPFIPITSLPYGKHILLVRADVGIESQGSAVLEIPIIVPTPLYYEPWFIFSLIVFAVFLVWLFFRLRMRQLLIHQKELQQEVDIRTQTILRDKELIEQQTRQLQQQAEEKMRFFANVTHEFRTPLSLISGPINKLIHTHPFSSQEAELLRIAYQNSQHLSDFVTQLSYLSSAENDQLRVHSEPVLIYSFLHHKMKEYELLASSKHLIFNHHIDIDPSVYLLADKKNIQLIINNLISNSLKFTPKYKNIFFTASFSAGHLSITVRDEGRGIPEEDLPYIFDRYFQSRQQHAPIEGGTGIGLALVKELVNTLNGSITVESTVGQGSTFQLSLPLTLVQAEQAQTCDDHYSTEDASVLEPITLTVRPPEGKDKFTLLLAEDNPYLQRYISILLGDHFEVHICSNGQEALDYLQQQETPDLLITDLMMPALDGLQLLREIRSNPSWAYMPVLMLTARSLRQDQEQAFTLGVDDYIIKPFQEAELFASLNNLLERKYIREAAGALYVQADSDAVEQLLAEDSQWLAELETITLNNFDKVDFNVNQLAKLMLMSRTPFYQKIRELTGMTPSQYILEIRLQQARRLLETGEETSFKKITQAVGLKDDRHFLKIYRQRFGKSPLDYT